MLPAGTSPWHLHASVQCSQDSSRISLQICKQTWLKTSSTPLTPAAQRIRCMTLALKVLHPALVNATNLLKSENNLRYFAWRFHSLQQKNQLVHHASHCWPCVWRTSAFWRMTLCRTFSATQCSLTFRRTSLWQCTHLKIREDSEKKKQPLRCFTTQLTDVDVILQFATERAQLGHNDFKYIASSMNIADVLTKALS